MKTTIMSDLHLGSDNCHRKMIIKFLMADDSKELILNGDTIDSINLKLFSTKDWEIVSILRKFVKERRLRLLIGNHDWKKSHPESKIVLPALLGCEMETHLEIESAGTKYLVLHGDTFDPWMSRQLVANTADWTYRMIQKFSKKTAKWLKHQSKKRGGVLNALVSSGLNLVKEKGIGGLILGHTHHHEDVHIEGIHYLNSGCWTEKPPHYICVKDGDRPELHQFD